MKGYFVTGTGTGVGKTFVTAAIAQAARHRGKRVFAFKPIETGCTKIGEELVGADQTILRDAAGGWQDGPLAGVYQFEPAVAPLFASQNIDLDLILAVFDKGKALADVVLVEGAGGWRVPITRDADMATLAGMLRLPVLIVGTTTLGTLNHSLLTIEAVERTGQVVDALILSQHPTDDPEVALRNQEEIQRRWNGDVVLATGDLSQLQRFT